MSTHPVGSRIECDWPGRDDGPMRNAQQVPVAIRAARTMWIIAIGAGIFETVLILASGRAGGGAVVGVLVRAVVFVAAVVVVLRMFAGRRWARSVLTATLGVLGTLSLTVDPLLWWVHGNSLSQLIQRSGFIDLLFGGSRVVHVAAVLGGCVLMFVPPANRYFRPGTYHSGSPRNATMPAAGAMPPITPSSAPSATPTRTPGWAE